jgi:E3 ubiquitin-protein ligase BRE1
MRTKEAVEVERKVAIRNVDKQLRVLEKLTESERNLANQVGLHEKEVTVLKARMRRHQERVAELEREVAEGLVWVTNEREKTSDVRRFSLRASR